MAGASWPWPMEMLRNFLLSTVKPSFLPSVSTQTVGSTPGKSTKNMGVARLDSAKVAAMS